MSEEIDNSLWGIFPTYIAYFNDEEYKCFLNQDNIKKIRRCSEYFIIDETRSGEVRLFAKLSPKGKLLVEFLKL